MDRSYLLIILRWHNKVLAPPLPAMSNEEATIELSARAQVAHESVKGEDLTECLPREVLQLIFLRVVFVRPCAMVCRRWYTLCQDPRIQEQLREMRWEEYASKTSKTRKFKKFSEVDMDVTSLTVGLDGRVFSGSGLNVVHVWSPSGDSVSTLCGHRGWVISLALSRDSLFSGSTDACIRMWALGDLSHTRTLVGHTGSINALVVSDDNSKVYSGSIDSTIRVWCAETGEGLKTLQGHDGPVYALVIGVAGELFSGGRDNVIKVWRNQTEPQTLRGHTDSIVSLAVGVGGLLFSGSLDGFVRTWAADDLSLLQVLECTEVNAFALTRHHALVSGCADGDLYIRRPTAITAKGRLYGDAIRVVGWTSVLFDIAMADNGTLYCAHGDGIIVTW